MRPFLHHSPARFVVLAVAALLAGCATGANPDAMVPTAVAGFDAGSPLRGAIAVDTVEGGSETNPLWMSKVGNVEFDTALKTTLRNEGLLAGDAPTAPYRLRVTLVALEQPWIGFTFTVGSTARYVIQPASGGNVVLDETVSANGEASIDDAFFAYERLRVANENSIRANIAEFIARLKARPPAPSG